MLKEILKDMHREFENLEMKTPSEKIFIETILNNIYQVLYKNGQPVHTIAIGILRGNTFDMYYRGRVLQKYAERFGAMSYETTISGKACEMYKEKGKLYLNLFSRKKIVEVFESASKEFKEKDLNEEAEALIKRAETIIDQGIGSFLVIPLSFGKKIIGIFTISSLKESDEKHILGIDIEKDLIPLAQMLNLILYMEKISYDKAEDMGRLLISSIDAKDEYQATHSLNVRTIIDMFIDELSRDKELRKRLEGIGFKLTVDRIERFRMAALLHDIGKIFVPSKILRKYNLNRDELLVRKMHPFLTYNILIKSNTLKDIAEIASLHHARYYIPMEKYENNLIGYPFDRLGQDKFCPECQIIALADTLNSITRSRPDREGLTLSDALDIIEKLENKFHEGLKDIFLTIMRRVEKNLAKDVYLPQLAKEYKECLWLKEPNKYKTKKKDDWSDLHRFLNETKFNTLSIIGLMNLRDAKLLLNKDIKIKNKSVKLINIQNKHIIFTIINLPKEEGFIWINNIFECLKSNLFNGKIAFAFVGRKGEKASIHEIYESLKRGLDNIRAEPVHYYLNQKIYKCE